MKCECDRITCTRLEQWPYCNGCKEKEMKRICLDFDGVIHSYKSGWKGVTDIPDPVVPGAIDFIKRASEKFKVAIFSARSKSMRGRVAMQNWLAGEAGIDVMDVEGWPKWFKNTEWPEEKPPAHIYIDDRGYCFKGLFPSVKEIEDFKSWVEGD